MAIKCIDYDNHTYTDTAAEQSPGVTVEQHIDVITGLMNTAAMQRKLLNHQYLCIYHKQNHVVDYRMALSRKKLKSVNSHYMWTDC